ncbi:helix-turn-helix domain-containing protein [Maridesulfovibrio sp.]|uniref:helix-turn-helix domain-containing protein n=1 Tax=Maridesulfovibrio sp. TaxID=2795000 RepID=UPI002AA88D1C|nr:helix-turn-helix domain-containing protein [Maridesulfovibrio sp.]
MPDSSKQVAGLVAGLTEKDATAMNTFLERLKLATNAKSDSELARFMGLRQSAMSSAKSRGQIPASWLVNIAINCNISADWLLTGDGAMHRGEALLRSRPSEQDGSCAQCQELEAELAEERKLVRELTNDFRDAMKENRELNRELRLAVKESSYFKAKAGAAELRMRERPAEYGQADEDSEARPP